MPWWEIVLGTAGVWLAGAGVGAWGTLMLLNTEIGRETVRDRLRRGPAAPDSLSPLEIPVPPFLRPRPEPAYFERPLDPRPGPRTD